MDSQLTSLLELTGLRLPAEPPGEPLASLLIETAFLMAVADDRLNPTELELLSEVMAFVRGRALDQGEFETALERLNEARSRDGVDGRLRFIGTTVASTAERDRLLRFGAVVALCDRRVVPREHGTLFKLGKVLGHRPEQILPVVDEVRRSLGPA